MKRNWQKEKEQLTTLFFTGLGSAGGCLAVMKVAEWTDFTQPAGRFLLLQYGGIFIGGLIGGILGEVVAYLKRRKRR